MIANLTLETWAAPSGATPIDRIRPEHFPTAFAQGIAEHQREALRAPPAVGRR